MEDKAFQDLVYQLRSTKLTENQTEGMKLAVAKQRKDLKAKRDPNPELTIVIEDVLAKHREDDMVEFLKRRQCLNNVNGWLMCLFHLFQLAGIMMTSYAVSHGSTTLVWTGVILNSLASIMQIYIKMHDASLNQMMTDLQLIKEGISVPPTVTVLPMRDPKGAAMANRRVAEHEQCIVPYEDMSTEDDEDPHHKALMVSLGIIDKHKNDLEVELTHRLNTVEGKYESNGQQMESMESELDDICLRIKGIDSELDSLGQVCPRAIAVSAPSLPPYSYPYTVQRDYFSSKVSQPAIH